MFPALFALLFTTGLFLGAVFGLFRPTAADFGQRHAAARDAGEWQKAVLWLRRQLAADPTALEVWLQLSEAYSVLGEAQAAAGILQQIAPPDRVVFGPAHLKRASRLAAGGLADPEVRTQTRCYIELALTADPAKGQGTVDRDAAHGLLAEVLAVGGDWQGVFTTTQKIASPSPTHRILAAMALKNLGRLPEAIAAADEAMRELGSGNQLEERFRRTSVLAQAAFVKDEIGPAVDAVLAAGNEPVLQSLKSSIIRQAAQRLRAGGGRDTESWLEILLRGLVVLPEDRGLTTELVEGVAQWRSLPGFVGRTHRRVRDAGLEAHLQLLGAIASLERNRPDEASEQFEYAWQLLPGNPVLANNHAALLATRPSEADPAGALEIINEVLKKHPNDPAFLDTKGQILLRLGRFEEAVVMLEAALKGAPDRGTHASLAEAYTQLGNTELAASHRRLANPK